MSQKNCVPVRIRGVDYPSIKAAAAALGISPVTISASLNRYGHAEGVGLSVKTQRRRPVPRKVRPVRLHGRDFPSVKVAAEELGLNYHWLYKAITRQQPVDASERILAAMDRGAGAFGSTGDA